jgi:hypothetical protein
MAADALEPGRRASPWDSLRGKLLKVGLLLLFVIVDPFGLQRATLEASRRVTDRLDSAVYEAPSANLIRVVLVDDTRVAAEGWPPALDFWANLIDSLGEAGPRAIFLDVALTQRRLPAGEFDAMIAARRAASGTPPVPLIVADNARAAVLRGAETPCDAEQPIGRIDPATIGADARRRAVSTLLHELACGATGLVFYDWRTRNDPRGYPLWITGERLRHDHASARGVAGPSAALALAQIVCADPPRQLPAWCAAGPLSAADVEGLVPLIPRWPLAARLAALDTSLSRDAVLGALARGCVLFAPPAGIGRLLGLAEMLAVEMFGNLAPLMSERVGWPRIRTDGDAATESPGAAGDRMISAAPCPIPAPVHHAGFGALDDTQRALLAGTVVLVGDARATSPDRVASPIHGTIPGVFLHAVALENLLTSGLRYEREQPNLGDLSPAVPALLQGVGVGEIVDWSLQSGGLFLAFGLSMWRGRLLARRPRPAPPGLAWFGAPRRIGWRALILLASLALLVLGVLANFLAPGGVGAAAIALLGLGLCLVTAGRRGPPEAPEARARRLTRQFRLATVLCVLAGLGATAAAGVPASDPLLVILFASGIAIPVLDQSPLDE